MPLDIPKQLGLDLGSLIDVSISGDQISTAHRLPDTRRVKNRIIVKFVQRDKREEFYKKKKKLIGKLSSLLPSFQAKIWAKVSSVTTRFILMSRWPLREEIVWKNWCIQTTAHSQILMDCQREDSTTRDQDLRILSFSTYEKFENFLYENNNGWVLYNISLFTCTHIYTDLYFSTLYVPLLI